MLTPSLLKESFNDSGIAKNTCAGNIFGRKLKVD